MSRSILFVKIGAIGDVVMALPAVQYLKSQGHHVTWAVGRAAEPIVRNFTKVDKVIVVDEVKLLKGHLFEKLNQVAQFQTQIFFHRFDQVILAHADPRYQILTALKTTHPIRFDFPREIHHADAYLKLAQQAVQGTASRTEDFLPRPLLPWRGLESRKIALAPGGARNVLADDNLRRWPLEYYAEVTQRLIAKGFEIHVFGAPSDSWVLEGFRQIPVVSQIGKYDLISLIKEWSNYRFLITHDSGPLHLAGLANLPVYGIFGPTLPDWRMPKDNQGAGIVLQPALECQPCYNGKTYALCEHKNCMRFLKPEILLSKISDNHLRI